ncbi:MAG TPA: hypothetical protein VGF45_20920 [Polyangia bacterium]
MTNTLLLFLLLVVGQAARPRPALPVIVPAGGPQPSWLPALAHELRAAGFNPTLTEDRHDAGCAVQVTAVPAHIDVVLRAAEGGWVVEDEIALAGHQASRRRAIVRAVEILRARCTWMRAPDSPQPDASEALAPAPVPPAPEPLAVAATHESVPHPEHRRRLGLALSGGLVAAGGGLGNALLVGTAVRWEGDKLALWTRAELGITSQAVTAEEGTASVRLASLSLGAAWIARSQRRISPLVGLEVAGLLVRAQGMAQPGYRGRAVSVPGASIGPTVGVRARVGDGLIVGLQTTLALVAWEPRLAFAGRRVASWSGPLLTTNVEMGWRF